MKIEITSCNNQEAWYKNKIGKQFNVDQLWGKKVLVLIGDHRWIVPESDYKIVEGMKFCVGDKVKFENEKQRYTIQACNNRFLICTKPFNARKTVLYTIVDLKEKIRGTENLVFGIGAETREQCEDMLKRLMGEDEDMQFVTEISHRNRISLNIEPKKCIMSKF